MKFEIQTPSTVRIVHVNLRAEKHGEDNVPAVDLKLRMETTNQALSMFHPELLRALYYSSEPARAQADVEGVQPILPNRVFEKLLPLRWKDEGTGYTLRIDHGLGGQSDLVLGDCTINHFTFEPKEGGTVVLEWRLQNSTAGERERGKLTGLIDCEVKASLTAPEVIVADAAPAPAKGKTKGKAASEPLWPFPNDPPQTPATQVTTRKRKPAAKDASQIFVEQHGKAA